MNVAATFANAILLLWCWLQNREARSLAWIAAAYAVAGAGNILLAANGLLPETVALNGGNALVIVGLGFIWVAGRTFNGRASLAFVPLAVAASWVGLTFVPSFGEDYETRLIASSVVNALFCLDAARELWRRDGLRSRLPIAAVLVFHAVVVLLRIPVAVIEGSRLSGAFDNPWFTPFALEALIFVQVAGLLFLALTKERAEARLRRAALTDPLTELANRRAFFEDGAALVAEQKRRREPVSLIAFDLDRFKQVNDTYGHPFGDAVLQAFAAAVRTGLRSADLAGRIGGEEFAAILPGATEAEARAAAERVIGIFAELVGQSEADQGRFTASAGLAVSTGAETLEALFSAADKAMYEAKRSGGDQLRLAVPVLA